jgi:adenosylcobinamide-GDP ribazoletransferase
MFKKIKSVIGFLTIVPVEEAGIREVANNMWLFPLVGAFIALPPVILGYLALFFFPPTISFGLALFALIALTGFQHFDGLLDFGDAIMCKGGRENRMKAMHDVNIGAGGFALAFFTLLFSYFALIESQNFVALVVAEMSAKFSMVLTAYLGRPSHEGIGSVFIKAVDREILVFSSFVYFLLMFVACWLVKSSALAVPITIFVSVLILTTSNKAFGGICGDVFGATNELTRMAVLVTL